MLKELDDYSYRDISYYKACLGRQRCYPIEETMLKSIYNVIGDNRQRIIKNESILQSNGEISNKGSRQGDVKQDKVISNIDMVLSRTNKGIANKTYRIIPKLDIDNENIVGLSKDKTVFKFVREISVMGDFYTLNEIKINPRNGRLYNKLICSEQFCKGFIEAYKNNDLDNYLMLATSVINPTDEKVVLRGRDVTNMFTVCSEFSVEVTDKLESGKFVSRLPDLLLTSGGEVLMASQIAQRGDILDIWMDKFKNKNTLWSKLLCSESRVDSLFNRFYEFYKRGSLVEILSGTCYQNIFRGLYSIIMKTNEITELVIKRDSLKEILDEMATDVSKFEYYIIRCFKELGVLDKGYAGQDIITATCKYKSYLNISNPSERLYNLVRLMAISNLDIGEPSSKSKELILSVLYTGKLCKSAGIGVFTTGFGFINSNVLYKNQEIIDSYNEIKGNLYTMAQIDEHISDVNEADLLGVYTGDSAIYDISSDELTRYSLKGIKDKNAQDIEYRFYKRYNFKNLLKLFIEDTEDVTQSEVISLIGRLEYLSKVLRLSNRELHNGVSCYEKFGRDLITTQYKGRVSEYSLTTEKFSKLSIEEIISYLSTYKNDFVTLAKSSSTCDENSYMVNNNIILGSDNTTEIAEKLMDEIGIDRFNEYISSCVDADIIEKDDNCLIKDINLRYLTGFDLCALNSVSKAVGSESININTGMCVLKIDDKSVDKRFEIKDFYTQLMFGEGHVLKYHTSLGGD